MASSRLTWLALLGSAAALALLSIRLAPALTWRQTQTACARQARDILYNLLQAPTDTAWLDEALTQISPACAGVPASQALLSNVYFQAGNRAWQAQEWTAAAAAYRTAIDRDPNQALPHRRLAEILLYRQQQPTAALTHLQQAQALAPHESYTYMVMAHAHAALNDPEAGLQAAQQALTVAQTPYGYMVQGEMLAALQRWPEAIASLRASLALDDRSAPAYLLLGNALQANGEMDAARQAWAEAQRRDPHIAIPPISAP